MTVRTNEGLEVVVPAAGVLTAAATLVVVLLGVITRVLIALIGAGR
jgi:hypothetical protein